MTTKDARILELVLEASAKNEKTVVFCTWVAQMERLKYFFEAQNVKTMCLGGGTSKWEKWESIDTWRSDPEHQVLLASIDSMGTAVNLTSLMPDEFKCRQVIFGSPEWAPNKMEQAWCRVYRIGQSEETHVHFLYHKGTIEEDMDEMLYQKRTTIAKAQDRVEITRDDTKVYHSYHEIATRIINKYQESGQ
jgi:SNF2 family DNA or RNA helicase